MDINLNINAPELVIAIHALASALDRRSTGIAHAASVLECKKEIAEQQAPVQLYNTPAEPVAQNTIVPAYTPPAAVPIQQATITPAPMQMPTTPAPVPTAQQTYTMEQLAVAATQLVDAGRRQELVTLLSNFGVQALTALPKEQYGNFATQLRAMGAKI